ncbi:MAG: hypothetical protein K8I29_19780 [Alphaproteobacteria bacterium]|uniref:DHHA1 domain-containing protein n=1 Tax=Candidatus Nitrobium versatile TaxID=2884831 RepID=A0A953M3T5_9BACT|nr:hypothetical protein [Candidatus Nitrobium versatile]
MKCFYHKADMDGKCSGAIVKMVFPSCEMIGINYGDTFPWERIKEGEAVFMVDFCLQPFEDMERLNRLCTLTWIDHHKSAIEEMFRRKFRAIGGQSLVDGLAACELTWAFLHATQEIPRAVHLLGRYDVWEHHNHPGALEFQYGIRNAGDCRPENQTLWQELFYLPARVEEIIKEGALLLSYEERQNEAYVKSCAFEVELDGLRCIAVNKGLANSLLFKSVYDPEKHDAMLAFVRRPGKWTVSIYADKPEVDASAICKARGGGGHKGAAGFQCETLPF